MPAGHRREVRLYSAQAACETVAYVTHSAGKPRVSATAGSAGFFGKLPARGDFVRDGLPGSFVGPWDDWVRRVLVGSQDQLGAGWLPAWMEAPVWRFALAPGLCGPAPALGLMLPSVDRAGRYFPLTFATLSAPVLSADEPWDDRGDVAAWLDRSEAAGVSALEQGLGPDQVAALVPAPLPGAGVPADGSLWWTTGAPRVAATRLRFATLPDVAGFTRMLSDVQSSHGQLSDGQPAEPSA